MNRAIFLDRDGTVNEEVGYLSDLRQLRLLPGAGKAIRRLNEAGYKVIIVTNQSGVARGYFPESFVHETHEFLKRMLKDFNAVLDGMYYCPHHPKAGASQYTRDCNCRKPAPGLLFRAAQEHNLDLSASYMVGDKWSDVELGQRAGCKSILVRTGYGNEPAAKERTENMLPPDFIAHDLADAVDWILSGKASPQK